jgi:RNA polymerase sigma factor (sigma-70 family)
MSHWVATARRSEARTTAYDQHRRYVLAVLSRRCRWLAPDEREALLHDAWAIMLEKERAGTLDVGAMAPGQIRAYVTQTALVRALDESRRARMRDVPLEEDGFVAPTVAPHEAAHAEDEAARLREIVGELTPRQQTIVKLRFFFDRSPDEVQALLGVTERAYRRDLERALAIVAQRFALVRDGGFCDGHASLIRAYVAGVAGPGRVRRVRAHLATCPACRHYALELRTAAGKVAVFAPLPVLTFDHERLGGLADAVLAAKQHVASLGARVDPTAPAALAGARPGALVAAVGACVALGGGATYCVVDRVAGGKPPGSDAHVSRRIPDAALATRRIAPPSVPATYARRPEPVAPAPTRTAARTTAPSKNTKKKAKVKMKMKVKVKVKVKAPKERTTAARDLPAASATTTQSAGASHEFGFEARTGGPPARTTAPSPAQTAAEGEFGP